MTTWALLAPGPSASAAQAEKVRGMPLGAIGCAYQLAPWADFIAASDASWWGKYPQAKELQGRKFCMATPVKGVETIRIPGLESVTNSGVLGLECAVRAGATRILLLGFDMHGTHFFGRYENGLTNTVPAKRKMHLQQYARWGKMNRGIEVINCTQNSALQCFPTARIEDVGNLFGAQAQPERVRASELHCTPA